MRVTIEDENLEAIQWSINEIYISVLKAKKYRKKLDEEAYHQHIKDCNKALYGLNDLLDKYNKVKRSRPRQRQKG